VQQTCSGSNDARYQREPWKCAIRWGITAHHVRAARIGPQACCPLMCARRNAPPECLLLCDFLCCHASTSFSRSPSGNAAILLSSAPPPAPTPFTLAPPTQFCRLRLHRLHGQLPFCQPLLLRLDNMQHRGKLERSPASPHLISIRNCRH
jgi:hypothetical protein